MLILSRKPGQVIRIGDDIMVTVMAIEGNRGKLGFDAPQDIQVDREEIAERRKTEPRG